MTGVLAAIAVPPAEAEVALFAIATYATDDVLVRAGRLAGRSRAAAGGHAVIGD
jgi:hypothetical protein